MIIYVLCDTDGDDLIYRMACKELGLSPVFRQERKGHYAEGGNPYLIYGRSVKDWTGKHSYTDVTLLVFRCRSGRMNAHLED